MRNMEEYLREFPDNKYCSERMHNKSMAQTMAYYRFYKYAVEQAIKCEQRAGKRD